MVISFDLTYFKIAYKFWHWIKTQFVWDKIVHEDFWKASWPRYGMSGLQSQKGMVDYSYNNTDKEQKC